MIDYEASTLRFSEEPTSVKVCNEGITVWEGTVAEYGELLTKLQTGQLYEHDGEARTSNGEYVSASEALQNAIEWGMCRVGEGTE